MPDHGGEELQKLRELGETAGQNALLIMQMFDSMIQSHRATIRIQTAQQAELTALQSQLETLQAQITNLATTGLK
jgi:hypothetical protein